MCRRRPSNTSPVAGCSSAYPLTTRRSSSKLALWWGFLRADRQRGFDLTQAPLARCTLLQWDKCHWQLIWTFHHMLADGQSYPMLIREAFGGADTAGGAIVLAAPHGPGRLFG